MDSSGDASEISLLLVLFLPVEMTNRNVHVAQKVLQKRCCIGCKRVNRIIKTLAENELWSKLHFCLKLP